MNWIKENWFKIAIVGIAIWFLLILQNGIEIKISDGEGRPLDLNTSVDVTGWLNTILD